LSKGRDVKENQYKLSFFQRVSRRILILVGNESAVLVSNLRNNQVKAMIDPHGLQSTNLAYDRLHHLGPL
jgi:hypothetical protein